jgi:hypothetical protein
VNENLVIRQLPNDAERRKSVTDNSKERRKSITDVKEGKERRKSTHDLSSVININKT